jgi:hypothetical protein
MVQQDSKQNGKQKKGKQIIVTGGKYQGEKGWIDESQGEKGYTKKQVYIIFVDDDENEVTKRVFQRSIEVSEWSCAPETFMQAALDQHTLILCKTKELSQLLASLEPSLQEADVDEYLNLFKGYVLTYQVRQAQARGVTGTRRVQFGRDNMAAD